ncbi:MAG: CFI-box-CTERM domain-containing protein [Lachnospiraceae bacterium]|nr:hypothetical protein [Lachnospiraceae bacterium]MDY5741531.1 CFI-box-CTERM domain-containing protein [Lachnospiraceae bacterium]
MIEQLLELQGDPLKDFNKKKYPDKFEAYYEAAQPILEACVRDLEPEKGISGWQKPGKELAEAALAKRDRAAKSKRSRLEVDLNLIMTIYLIPAVQRYFQADAEPIIEELISQWKQVFPASQIRATSYEQVLGGFRDRLCYITTATCQALEKSADCHELAVLRRFRDECLLQTEQGRRLVAHYYDTAPTIVNRIREQKQAEEIFSSLYESYISPCVRLIESGQAIEAVSLYTDMVETLEMQYLYAENQKTA